VNIERSWESGEIRLYPTVKTDTDWVKLIFISSLKHDRPATEPPSPKSHWSPLPIHLLRRRRRRRRSRRRKRRRRRRRRRRTG
jgi:hypothetical protein